MKHSIKRREKDKKVLLEKYARIISHPLTLYSKKAFFEEKAKKLLEDANDIEFAAFYNNLSFNEFYRIYCSILKYDDNFNYELISDEIYGKWLSDRSYDFPFTKVPKRVIKKHLDLIFSDRYLSYENEDTIIKLFLMDEEVEEILSEKLSYKNFFRGSEGEAKLFRLKHQLISSYGYYGYLDDLDLNHEYYKKNRDWILLANQFIPTNSFKNLFKETGVNRLKELKKELEDVLFNKKTITDELKNISDDIYVLAILSGININELIKKGCLKEDILYSNYKYIKMLIKSDRYYALDEFYKYIEKNPNADIKKPDSELIKLAFSRGYQIHENSPIELLSNTEYIHIQRKNDESIKLFNDYVLKNNIEIDIEQLEKLYNSLANYVVNSYRLLPIFEKVILNKEYIYKCICRQEKQILLDYLHIIKRDNLEFALDDKILFEACLVGGFEDIVYRNDNVRKYKSLYSFIDKEEKNIHHYFTLEGKPKKEFIKYLITNPDVYLDALLSHDIYSLESMEILTYVFEYLMGHNNFLKKYYGNNILTLRYLNPDLFNEVIESIKAISKGDKKVKVKVNKKNIKPVDKNSVMYYAMFGAMEEENNGVLNYYNEYLKEYPKARAIDKEFIKKAIESKSIIDESSPSDIYTEENIKLIISYQPNVIDYYARYLKDNNLGSLSNELIELAIGNGYRLSDNTPSLIMDNFTYIKVIMENGSASDIDYYVKYIDANPDKDLPKVDFGLFSLINYISYIPSVNTPISMLENFSKYIIYKKYSHSNLNLLLNINNEKPFLNKDDYEKIILLAHNDIEELSSEYKRIRYNNGKTRNVIEKCISEYFLNNKELPDYLKDQDVISLAIKYLSFRDLIKLVSPTLLLNKKYIYEFIDPIMAIENIFEVHNVEVTDEIIDLLIDIGYKFSESTPMKMKTNYLLIEQLIINNPANIKYIADYYADINLILKSKWYNASSFKIRNEILDGFNDDSIPEYILKEEPNKYKLLIYAVGFDVLLKNYPNKKDEFMNYDFIKFCLEQREINAFLEYYKYKDSVVEDDLLKLAIKKNLLSSKYDISEEIIDKIFNDEELTNLCFSNKLNFDKTFDLYVDYKKKKDELITEDIIINALNYITVHEYIEQFDISENIVLASIKKDPQLINYYYKKNNELTPLIKEKFKEKMFTDGDKFIDNLDNDIIYNILNKEDIKRLINIGIEFSNLPIEELDDELIIFAASRGYKAKEVPKYFLYNEVIVNEFIKLGDLDAFESYIKSTRIVDHQMVLNAIEHGLIISGRLPREIVSNYEYVKLAIKNNGNIESLASYLNHIRFNTDDEMPEIDYETIDNLIKARQNFGRGIGCVDSYEKMEYIVRKGGLGAIREYNRYCKESATRPVPFELYLIERYHHKVSYTEKDLSKEEMEILNANSVIMDFLKSKGLLNQNNLLKFFTSLGYTDKLLELFKRDILLYEEFLINHIIHNQHFVEGGIPNIIFDLYRPYLSYKYKVSNERLELFRKCFGNDLLLHYESESVIKLLQSDDDMIYKVFNMFDISEFTLGEFNDKIYDSIKQEQFGFDYPIVRDIFNNFKNYIINNDEDSTKYLINTVITRILSIYGYENQELESWINNLSSAIDLAKKQDYDALHELCNEIIRIARELYRKDKNNLTQDIQLPYKFNYRDKLKYGRIYILINHNYELIKDKISIDEDMFNILRGFILDEIQFNDLEKQKYGKLIGKLNKELNELIKSGYLDGDYEYEEYLERYAKKEYYVPSRSDELDVLKTISGINFDILKSICDNEKVYSNLIKVLKTYKITNIPNDIKCLLSKINLDLTCSFATIDKFISYYPLFLKSEIKRQNSMSKHIIDESNVEIKFISLVKNFISVNSEVEEICKLLGKEDYSLIVKNPGPNSSGYQSDKRIKRAMELVPVLYNNDSITIPSFDEVISLDKGDSKKDINVIVGNRTNMCNLTHGERTGACMRIYGYADNLFNFCLENPNGFHIRFEDPETHEYISRVSGFRNGNTVFLNQLRDSSNKSKYTSLELTEYLKIVANMLIESTRDSSCPIENVFVNINYAYSEVNDTVYDLSTKDILSGFTPMYTDVGRYNGAYLIASTSDSGYEELDYNKDNVEVYKPVRDKTYGIEIGRDKLVELINSRIFIKYFLVNNNVLYFDDIEIENVLDGYVGPDFYVYVDNNYEIHYDYFDMSAYHDSSVSLEEMEKYKDILINKYDISDIKKIV